MYFKNLLSGIVALVVVSVGCNQTPTNHAGQPDHSGQAASKGQLWRATLDLPVEDLPFTFTTAADGSWIIHNGDERIPTTIQTDGDTLSIDLSPFDSEIRVSREEDSYTGFWLNRARGDYRIPIQATPSEGRFPVAEQGTTDPTGSWEVYFKDEEEMEPALGRFQLEEGVLTGTFLTPTGDYRFLEGTMEGRTLWLSCFDGAHAFLFKASLSEDGNEMEGTFWSGKHWEQEWVATRNEAFTLPNPDSLTFIKPEYDGLAFGFPDLKGDTVNLEDERFRGKVLLVQIMGSWCPNCKDEMEFYQTVYPKYADQGFEIISLAYEAGRDPAGWRQAAQRLVDHYDLPWPVLLAGRASKSEAAAGLPMLNHVLSFPTSIFIDRSGEVRRIHTGFSGPATGVDYDKFVADFHKTVVGLLDEN